MKEPRSRAAAFNDSHHLRCYHPRRLTGLSCRTTLVDYAGVSHFVDITRGGQVSGRPPVRPPETAGPDRPEVVSQCSLFTYQSYPYLPRVSKAVRAAVFNMLSSLLKDGEKRASKESQRPAQLCRSAASRHGREPTPFHINAGPSA